MLKFQRSVYYWGLECCRHTQLHSEWVSEWQTEYCNPHCACAPRVNYMRWLWWFPATWRVSFQNRWTRASMNTPSLQHLATASHRDWNRCNLKVGWVKVIDSPLFLSRGKVREPSRGPAISWNLGQKKEIMKLINLHMELWWGRHFFYLQGFSGILPNLKHFAPKKLTYLIWK